MDAVFFSDDWGCQRGLLMAPADWRRFYKPAYRRMFDRVRTGGSQVWMHLCGNVTSILPDPPRASGRRLLLRLLRLIRW